MSIPIPIIDSVLDAGKTIINKIWMDKGDKAKLEITKQELEQNFELALKSLAQSGELTKLELIFKEHQAQRDYALNQFGSAEILKEMGKVGSTGVLS